MPFNKEKGSVQLGSFEAAKFNAIYSRLSINYSYLGRCYGRKIDMIDRNVEIFEFFDSAIMYARKVGIEEKKTDLLWDALISSGVKLHKQSKGIEAKAVFQEPCKRALQFYSPYHPVLTKAVRPYLAILSSSKEHADAVYYARSCYESLTTVDVNFERERNEDIADTAFLLSSISYISHKYNNNTGGNIVEMETLARKALHIYESIHDDPTHPSTGSAITQLISVLQLHENPNDEYKGLLGRSLAIYIKNHVVDDDEVLADNDDLIGYYIDIANTLPLGKVRMKHLENMFYTKCIK